MHRNIQVFLVFSILAATALAKPYAFGVTLAPFGSFPGTEIGEEMSQSLLIASGETPDILPGPGGTVGVSGEFSPLSFLALGAALDYAFRSSAAIGQGTEGEGDSVWIFTHAIELNLYGGFNLYKGEAGSLRADIGFLTGFMPKGQSQKAVIDGYRISVSGDAQLSMILGARVAFDWEWPLKIAAPEGASFALLTGAGFEYVFFRTNFSYSIAVPQPMSPSLRVGLLYRYSGRDYSERETDGDAGKGIIAP